MQISCIQNSLLRLFYASWQYSGIISSYSLLKNKESVNVVFLRLKPYQ